MMVRNISWTLAAVVAVSMAGCGGQKGAGTLPDPLIRFVNAAPTSQNLDFFMNDDRVATNVPYLGSMTDFREFEFRSDSEGGYDLKVRVNGNALDLDSQNETIPRDSSHLVIALGLPNPGSEFPKRTRVIPLRIDRERPIGNRSIVVVMNCLIRSPGLETPPITFQSIIPGDPTSIDNPQYKSENIQYGSIGNITIDSGSRTFIARRGETDALFQFAETTFNFQPGGIYFAVIGGEEGNVVPALRPSITFIQVQPED